MGSYGSAERAVDTREEAGATFCLGKLLVRGVTLAALLSLAAAALPGAALAEPRPATASPAAEANDPCGGDSRLLATLDRPTVGYSACAVAPQTVVIELGYQNQVQASTGNLAQYPQSLTRIGMAPRLELDLIGPGFNRQESRGITSQGYSDSGLGLKVELQPHDRYTIAVDVLHTWPNGTGGFSGGGATDTANLDVAYAATSRVGLTTTLAFSDASGISARGVSSRYGVFAPSLALTDQLSGSLQLYVEYGGVSKLAPDAGGRGYVDYGVQRLLGRRLEVDAEIGRAIAPKPDLRFTYYGMGIGIQLY